MDADEEPDKTDAPVEGPECQEANEDEASEPVIRRYGHIKRLGEEYGFIVCPDIRQQYGRDVYVTRSEYPQDAMPSAGQCVSFVLEFNELGKPQAKSIKLESQIPEQTGQTVGAAVPRAEPAQVMPAESVLESWEQAEVATEAPTVDTSERKSPLSVSHNDSWADIVDDFVEEESEVGQSTGRRQHRRRRGRRGEHEADAHGHGTPPAGLQLTILQPRQFEEDFSPEPSIWHDASTPLYTQVPNEIGPDTFAHDNPMLAQSLWSDTDIVRALCFRHPRDFLLSVESDLMRLIVAPLGATLRLPALAPHYRSLLRALCVRFRMRDSEEDMDGGREVCVSVTPDSQVPLPLSALVLGTWAQCEPSRWTRMQHVRKSVTPGPGLKLPPTCNLSAFSPGAVGTALDGDAVAQAVWSRVPETPDFKLSHGTWVPLKPDPFLGTGDMGSGFVVTFTLEHTVSGEGVGFVMCADDRAHALQSLLPRLRAPLDAKPGPSPTHDGDLYLLLIEPQPRERAWCVRGGHAGQVHCSRLDKYEVPWTRRHQSTFWVATHADKDGVVHVEVGLDRFPWCSLWRTSLQREGTAAFPHVAFAALGEDIAANVHGVTLERSPCLDRASRDHVVHLAWPHWRGAEPPYPSTNGIVEVLGGGLAICESPGIAANVSRVAASRGWEARTLAKASTEGFAVPGPGCGTSAAKAAAALQRRAAECLALGNRVGLELGFMGRAVPPEGPPPTRGEIEASQQIEASRHTEAPSSAETFCIKEQGCVGLAETSSEKDGVGDSVACGEKDETRAEGPPTQGNTHPTLSAKARSFVPSGGVADPAEPKVLSGGPKLSAAAPEFKPGSGVVPVVNQENTLLADAAAQHSDANGFMSTGYGYVDGPDMASGGVWQSTECSDESLYAGGYCGTAINRDITESQVPGYAPLNTGGLSTGPPSLIPSQPGGPQTEDAVWAEEQTWTDNSLLATGCPYPSWAPPQPPPPWEAGQRRTALSAKAAEFTPSSLQVGAPESSMGMNATGHIPKSDFMSTRQNEAQDETLRARDDDVGDDEWRHKSSSSKWRSDDRGGDWEADQDWAHRNKSAQGKGRRWHDDRWTDSWEETSEWKRDKWLRDRHHRREDGWRDEGWDEDRSSWREQSWRRRYSYRDDVRNERHHSRWREQEGRTWRGSDRPPVRRRPEGTGNDPMETASGTSCSSCSSPRSSSSEIVNTGKAAPPLRQRESPAARPAVEPEPEPRDRRRQPESNESSLLVDSTPELPRERPPPQATVNKAKFHRLAVGHLLGARGNQEKTKG